MISVTRFSALRTIVMERVGEGDSAVGKQRRQQVKQRFLQSLPVIHRQFTTRILERQSEIKQLAALRHPHPDDTVRLNLLISLIPKLQDKSRYVDIRQSANATKLFISSGKASSVWFAWDSEIDLLLEPQVTRCISQLNRKIQAALAKASREYKAEPTDEFNTAIPVAKFYPLTGQVRVATETEVKRGQWLS